MEKLVNVFKNSKIVEKKDLVKNLKTIPIEVVQIMLLEQLRSGNKANVEVFKDNWVSDKKSGGFDWDKSKYFTENQWESILLNNKEEIFFAKFPRYIHPSYMIEFPIGVSKYIKRKCIQLFNGIGGFGIESKFSDNRSYNNKTKQYLHFNNRLNIVLDDNFDNDKIKIDYQDFFKEMIAFLGPLNLTDYFRKDEIKVVSKNNNELKTVLDILSLSGFIWKSGEYLEPNKLIKTSKVKLTINIKNKTVNLVEDEFLVEKNDYLSVDEFILVFPNIKYNKKEEITNVIISQSTNSKQIAYVFRDNNEKPIGYELIPGRKLKIFNRLRKEKSILIKTSINNREEVIDFFTHSNICKFYEESPENLRKLKGTITFYCEKGSLRYLKGINYIDNPLLFKEFNGKYTVIDYETGVDTEYIKRTKDLTNEERKIKTTTTTTTNKQNEVTEITGMVTMIDINFMDIIKTKLLNLCNYFENIRYTSDGNVAILNKVNCWNSITPENKIKIYDSENIINSKTAFLSTEIKQTKIGDIIKINELYKVIDIKKKNELLSMKLMSFDSGEEIEYVMTENIRVLSAIKVNE